ncbi:MAG: TlyA family RNA methyltransferase [Hyphomicrobiales bacterium]|nr:TlyA family RNA methyltransferase [Hyphomicrobiales bacterium]
MSTARRVDQALVERGFFESRARAQAAIKAGRVTLDGVILNKPSLLIAEDAALEASPEHPYVSRAALKLVAALDEHGLQPEGLMCLDVGASTGGFSEVLLARGARHVVAVDVGHDQLHARLVGHPRLTLLEGRDARSLGAQDLAAPADMITIDVSFIPLARVLGPVLALAAPAAVLVALVKPQFEVGRAFVGKGVVRDESARQRACDDVCASIRALGWQIEGVQVSPLRGGAGNIEYLVTARRQP